MSLGSLRQGAQKVSNNSGSGSKGGKGGYFNKLRVTKLTPELQGVMYANENPGDPILFVQPQTLYQDLYDTDETGTPRGTVGPAYHILTHQVQGINNGKKTFADFVCTAGPNPHAPQPCVGCHAVDSGNKSVGNARQQWAFNVKHLVPYHEVPLVDYKTKAIKYRKDKPNEPVLVLQQCQTGTPSERLYRAQRGPNGVQITPCEHCQKGIQLIYGAPKVFVLGKSHLENLLSVDQTLEATCAHCMTRLIKTGYHCGSCNTELLNLSKSTSMTNSDVADYAARPQQCNCGHVGLTKPKYLCGYDPSGMYALPNGPCGQTRPLSIFDCVMYIHKEGESVQSKLIVGPPIPKHMFATSTGQADLDQWLKMPHLVKTFDLQDMFKPLATDEQAKICGIANPYAQQGQQYGAYPGQQQQWQAPPQNPGMPPQQPQYQSYPPQAGYAQQPQLPTAPSIPGTPFSGRPDYNK